MDLIFLIASIVTVIIALIIIIIAAVRLKSISHIAEDMVITEDLDELQDDIERIVQNGTNLIAKGMEGSNNLLINLQAQQKNAINTQLSTLQQTISHSLSTQDKNTAAAFHQMQSGLNAQLEQMTRNIGNFQSNTNEQISNLSESVANGMSDIRKGTTESNTANFNALQSALTAQLDQMTKAIESLKSSNNSQISELRTSVANGMESVRKENADQLSQIKKTVDDQLHDALDKKLKQSFDSVVEQLSQVQKGLGEMQTLATSVGDLKKVLSNTKTRGILGEAQLGAILEQILSNEQYDTNVCTVTGSKDPVEYAIKLPGNGEETVYLPIDAKFPLETYQRVVDAYDSANAVELENAKKALEVRLLSEAKDIHSKYIHVPETTEFGIMFLPIEGLYAEAVRMGMVEKLQNKYHIIIAGPTTMSALVNSLQMGFRTLAIQKRSAEVWTILGNVKSEFDKFEDVLSKTQQRLNQAGDELEKLVGVRTRQINKSLSSITGAVESDALAVDSFITDYIE